jgi:hypothetical protein
MPGLSREIQTVLNPDFRDMLFALSGERVEFLLVGAYAMAVHGLPRATGDLDIWIRPEARNADRLMRALGRFGAPLDSITSGDFTQPNLVFQIGVVPRRLDLLTSVDGVDFDAAWKRRKLVSIDDVEVPVLSLPDLKANKRAVGRLRDLADVEALEELEDG